MIIENFEQGSPEWFAARVGIPSASVFDKLITSKGALSTSRQKLIYKLAGEKVLGEKEEGYSNGAMQRGIELEPEARSLFELITGKEVKEVGLCYYDERKDRSCSPDGLVGTGMTLMEGLEIKCPELATHVEYLMGNKLPTKYFAQVQGSMYITGLEKWYFMSYFPSMKPLIIEIVRDEIWIAKLSKALDDLVVELDETHKLLIEGEE
ncbi:YqaJ viral recombinase family protein [Candidatus Pacearchaeota archaeon]|nr:YqaJ viral recombinase family protein [Candidatus Pacearchaeota archaeon]